MASIRVQALAAQLPKAISPAIRISRSSFASARPSSFLRPLQPTQPQPQPGLIRLAHNIPRPRARSDENPDATDPSGAPSPASTGSAQQATPSRISQQPHYELTFTCVPCGDRSRHKVSKQGYHHGSVLITCPGCRNRHVISDHLGIFLDRKVTVEDLMRERGQLVKRGTLGEDGDVEFWEDGTVTKREDGAQDAPEVVARPDAELDNAPPGASFKSVGGQKSG